MKYIFVNQTHWANFKSEAVRHMMNKGFQNCISQFEKKITPSSPISFHSFGNLKKVWKKFFFHVDMIAIVAYAEQLLPRDKAAVCCILPRGIVWTQLKTHHILFLYDGFLKGKWASNIKSLRPIRPTPQLLPLSF